MKIRATHVVWNGPWKFCHETPMGNMLDNKANLSRRHEKSLDSDEFPHKPAVINRQAEKLRFGLANWHWWIIGRLRHYSFLRDLPMMWPYNNVWNFKDAIHFGPRHLPLLNFCPSFWVSRRWPMSKWNWLKKLTKNISHNKEAIVSRKPWLL